MLLFAFGCAPEPQPGGDAQRSVAAAGQRLVVFSVNYPLHDFARRIGGDSVEAVLPVPGEVDPAFWSPTAEEVAGFQGADLILLNGAGYAAWVDRVTLPESRLVDTSAGFADRYLALDGATVHSHGPEGEHSHGTVAFTTWLDPVLAGEQAAAVAAALSRARPHEATVFGSRLELLQQELQALDSRLQAALGGGAATPLLASHPVYPYLARRYALDLRSVHFEPDTMPDRAAWSELESIVASHAARWMLWEAQPRAEIAQRLRSMGIEPVVYAPCGNTPRDGDFIGTMTDNVERLVAALKQ